MVLMRLRSNLLVRDQNTSTEDLQMFWAEGSRGKFSEAGFIFTTKIVFS